MIYDLSTREKAKQTLIELLGKESETGIDKDVYLKRYNEDINAINLSNVLIKAFHITSSGNECKNIRNDGLQCLQDVLRNPNSELTTFLREYGITLNVDQEETLLRNYRIPISLRRMQQIYSKIYAQPWVCAFLFCDGADYFEHSHRPEILCEIENALCIRGIVRKWEKETRSYCVELYISPYTLSAAKYPELKSDHTEHFLKRKLVEWALDRLNPRNTYGEINLQNIVGSDIHKITPIGG